MHRQVMDWINTKYPNPNHKYVNGAVPATGMFPLHLRVAADSPTYEEMFLVLRQSVFLHLFRRAYTGRR